jgi:hypothetical protein
MVDSMVEQQLLDAIPSFDAKLSPRLFRIRNEAILRTQLPSSQKIFGTQFRQSRMFGGN